MISYNRTIGPRERERVEGGGGSQGDYLTQLCVYLRCLDLSRYTYQAVATGVWRGKEKLFLQLTVGKQGPKGPISCPRECPDFPRTSLAVRCSSVKFLYLKEMRATSSLVHN